MDIQQKIICLNKTGFGGGMVIHVINEKCTHS